MTANSNDTPDFNVLVGDDVLKHHHDRADLHRRHPCSETQRYRREAAQQQSQTFRDGLSDEIRQLVDSEEALLYASNGVQLNTVKKLKQGHTPWQEYLDLHGRTVDQARDDLSRFMRDARFSQARCVLVVHGKAFRADSTPPVIKSYVNDWLRQFPEVLAFVSAQPRDGGTGAVYVLLKQQKG
ncbi:MAG: DNA-nicking Smr family endonuclease [Motiliproteus sp.]|jgi:DNA-nicking Smr family endonuclease